MNPEAGAQDSVAEVPQQQGSPPPVVAAPENQQADALWSDVYDDDMVSPEEGAQIRANLGMAPLAPQGSEAQPGSNPVAGNGPPDSQIVPDQSQPPPQNDPTQVQDPQGQEHFGQVRVRAQNPEDARFLTMLRAGVDGKDAAALVYGTAAAAAGTPTGQAAPPVAAAAPDVAAQEAVTAIEAEIAQLRKDKREATTSYDTERAAELDDQIAEKMLAHNRALITLDRAQADAQVRAEQSREQAAEAEFNAVQGRFPAFGNPNSAFRKTCDSIYSAMQAAGTLPKENIMTFVAEIAAAANPSLVAQQAPSQQQQNQQGRIPVPQVTHFQSPGVPGGAPAAPARQLTANDIEAEEERAARAWQQGYAPTGVNGDGLVRVRAW